MPCLVMAFLFHLWPMQFICYNGRFMDAQTPLFTVDNRGFKYGDGLFETAKVYNGTILLSSYHFQRLFAGLRMLQLVITITPAELTSKVQQLCEQNGCSALARVRITFFRTQHNNAAYVIEATTLTEDKIAWQNKGWSLTLHPTVRKSCDAFSNIKSANYLPYVLAGMYAAENKADECLVANMYDRICDGSKTNIFIIKDKIVYTPALTEGPVSGVMRAYTMDILKSCNYPVHETAITENDVALADEIFVTNAIEGLRWTSTYKQKQYGHEECKKIYQLLFSTIYT